MAVKLKWPILGIIIPSLLISMIGYGSHYFVFRQHFSTDKQIWYEIYLTMTWISYILAIKVDPGSPPKNFQPNSGEWRRWCKKCENYKPERSHHCKACNKCVLKMDHHCPWTYNCVGHGNLPHFLRFLFWVIFTTGFVFIELSKRVVQYYNDSNLPSYLVDKKEMFAVIFLLPIDFFIFLSLSILYIRCLVNLWFRGMTQIEVWEKERIESQLHTERMWCQIRRNYYKLHGKDMPKLTSWNRTARYFEVEQNENNDSKSDDDIVPKDFTIDDLVFPYDLGMWVNLVDACGYPWMWLLPWGGPRNNGIHFEKNEYMEDDQLSLPWPPDGGHQEISLVNNNDIELARFATHRKRRDPRSNMKRSEWMNDLGETLNDFGVDLDAEDIDHDDLIGNNVDLSSPSVSD